MDASAASPTERVSPPQMCVVIPNASRCSNGPGPKNPVAGAFYASFVYFLVSIISGSKTGRTMIQAYNQESFRSEDMSAMEGLVAGTSPVTRGRAAKMVVILVAVFALRATMERHRAMRMRSISRAGATVTTMGGPAEVACAVRRLVVKMVALLRAGVTPVVKAATAKMAKLVRAGITCVRRFVRRTVAATNELRAGVAAASTFHAQDPMEDYDADNENTRPPHSEDDAAFCSCGSDTNSDNALYKSCDSDEDDNLLPSYFSDDEEEESPSSGSSRTSTLSSSETLCSNSADDTLPVSPLRAAKKATKDAKVLSPVDLNSSATNEPSLQSPSKASTLAANESPECSTTSPAIQAGLPV
ncbi:hypothetical protein OQA88_7687 [Cercophora sp. LCS_1]